MEKSATHYLVEAFFVLRANISYVFIPAILSSGFYLSNLMSEDLKPVFFLFISFVLFIALPLFYGQFIEIINNGRRDTWINIFNNYWLKFILLSLILKGPIIILDLFVPKLIAFNVVLSFIIDIASIYILPLVLLKKEIFSSIQVGIKCLLGNFTFSSPLVMVSIFSVIFPFLIGLTLKYTSSQFLLAVFSIGLVFLLIVIEFTVFIAATMILKDKMFAS